MWLLAALLAALVLMTISTSMGLRSAARSLRMVSSNAGVEASNVHAFSNAGAEASNVHAFSIAPMMEYTDAHQRKLIRLITARSVLYTEMVTANALVRTDNQERFLEADFQKEDPVVLQLGGGDPQMMADAAKIAYDYGYKEFNINCGCPSEKVAGAGCFGAALMLNPEVVADLTSAISEVSGKSTSVKCRIGVNDDDSYEQLHRFVETVSARGNVDHFVVHARKALLGGKFSPADNRKIPPLKYQYVYRLVRDFPHLAFTLNGGVMTMEHTERIFTGRVPEADLTMDGSGGSICNSGGDGDAMASSSSSLSHPPRLAGVMVGRAVVDKPFHWGRVDSTLYNQADQDLSRREILERYASYAAGVESSQGPRARRALAKPLLGLFAGEPHGKLFRQKLDTYLLDSGKGMTDVIMGAASVLRAEVLDQRPSERHAWEVQREREMDNNVVSF